MKRIIALLTLFVLTFTSGYATTGETTKLTADDILYANIFYIDGIGYIKEDNKLKKIEGIEFYSIAGQRYIKKDGKIIKITENKVFRINNTNYVKSNGKFTTLNKFLTLNPIENNITKKGTFSDIFKVEKKENLKLSYLSQYKIEKIKSETLKSVSKLIILKDSKAKGTVELLNKNKFTTEQLNKMKFYYSDLGEIEIAKKINILENISKIDLQKVNRAILAKMNNQTIKIVKKTIDTAEETVITTEKQPENNTETQTNTSPTTNTNNIQATTNLGEDDEMIEFFKAMGIDMTDI